MKKHLITIIIAVVLFTPHLLSAQLTLTYEIGTDTSWKTSDVHYLDWNLTAYNDSDWQHVAVPGVNVCGNLCSMWIANGADVAYFRKSFILPSFCDSGILFLTVDDDYVIYINDSLVHVDNNNVANVNDTLIVTPFMHLGPNLISIVGVDEGGCELVCIRGQFFTLGKPTSVPSASSNEIVQLFFDAADGSYLLRSNDILNHVIIKIFDLNGKLLSAESHSQFLQKKFSMNNFSPGMYFLSILTNSRLKNFKLMKS